MRLERIVSFRLLSRPKVGELKRRVWELGSLRLDQLQSGAGLIIEGDVCSRHPKPLPQGVAESLIVHVGRSLAIDESHKPRPQTASELSPPDTTQPNAWSQIFELVLPPPRQDNQYTSPQHQDRKTSEASAQI